MKILLRFGLILGTFLIPLLHWRAIHDQTELPKHMGAVALTWVLALALLLIRSRSETIWTGRLPLPFTFAGLFTIWQLAIWPFAEVPSQSLATILITIESLTWCWLCYELLDSPKLRRWALRSIVGAGLLAAFFGLIQFEEKFPNAAPRGILQLGNSLRDLIDRYSAWGNPLSALEQTDAPGSFFGHTNIAAEFVVGGFVICCVLALANLWRSIRDSSWLRFFACLAGFGLAIPSALFLFRSGSRSVILAAAVGVLSAWAHMFVHDLIHRPLWRRRVAHVLFHVTLFAIIAGGSFFIAKKVKVSPRSGQEQVTLLERIKTSANFDNTTVRERLDLWANTFAMSQANPVFGVGPGNFRLAYPEYATASRVHEVGRITLRRQPSKPHNEYLNVVAENGYFGGTLVLFSLVSFLFLFMIRRNGFRRVDDDEDPVSVACISAIVAVLITAAFGFPFQQTGTRIMVLVLVGVGLRLASPQSNWLCLPSPRGAVLGGLILAVFILSAAHYRARYQASRSSADLMKGQLARYASSPDLGALRAADQMIHRVPSDPNLQLHRAHLYRSFGLLADAQEGYERALSYAPSMANAWLGLARVKFMNQRPLAAEKDVRRAIDLQPDEPQVLVAAGLIYESLGDRNQAISLMIKGLTTAPYGADRLQALLALTRIHSSLDNHLTASTYLGHAENMDQTHPSVLEAKAFFLERHQPKSDASLAAWQKFVALRPKNALARLRLCENWLKRGQYKKALAASEAAYLADNNLLIALYRRAQAQVGLELMRPAYDSLLEVVQKLNRPGFSDESLFLRCTTLMKQISNRVSDQAKEPAQGGKK